MLVPLLIVFLGVLFYLRAEWQAANLEKSSMFAFQLDKLQGFQQKSH